MIRMFRPTPEFKIISALMKSKETFTELKLNTNLSSRWLSKTLQTLLRAGVVEKSDLGYRIVSPNDAGRMITKDFKELSKDIADLHPAGSLHDKALQAAKLLSDNQQALGIILFGSLAKGEAAAESDIDLLVISRVESDLTDQIYSIMTQVNAPIEAVTMSFKQFLVNLLDEPTLLFGIMEGYEVLYDRLNLVRVLLDWKKTEIKERWLYDEGEGIWFEKRLKPYLRLPTTNS